ncbi:MAG: RHS repeat protein, partial [Spirochaetaceae bacterium]
VKIDTTPPEMPVSFNIIPGNNKIIVKYQVPSEDTTSIEMERTPSWDDTSVRELTALVYEDTEVSNGSEYAYRVRAIDRAGNKSEYTSWFAIMCGQELEEYDATKSTTAEFDGLTLYVQPNGMLDDTAAVRITEAVSAGITSRSSFRCIGPMYDLSAVDSDGEVVGEGRTLPKNYLAGITYDPALIPAGLTEMDLDVYYFDPVWNRWVLCDSIVDAENDTVYFTSWHFSLYTVQATEARDLSPEDVKEAGYSPFNTYMQHGSFDISVEGGSLSNSVSELALPGPAGFDLAISRMYSTSTAKADSFMVSDDALLPYLKNKADYAFTVGKGYRLDFPYIKDAGKNSILVLPGGSQYPFYEMEMKCVNHDTETSSTTYDEEGEPIMVVTKHYSRTLYLTPDDYADFVLIVEQNPDDNMTINYSSEYSDTVRVCNNLSYTLRFNDGTEYQFDAQGRPLVKVDSAGLNRIEFHYVTNQPKLDYIIDAVGRTVKFDYVMIKELPYIKKIWIENDPYGREVIYTHDDQGLLTSSIDAGKRTWSYVYTPTDMPSKNGRVSVDFYAAINGLGYESLDQLINRLDGQSGSIVYVPLMTELRGPGKGILEARYAHLAANESGFTVVKDVAIYPTEEAFRNKVQQRVTNYEYTLGTLNMPAKEEGATGEERGYIAATVARDGIRQTRYTFEANEKMLARWVLIDTTDDTGAGSPGTISEEAGKIEEELGDNLYGVSSRRFSIERSDYNEGKILERETYAYPEDSFTTRPSVKSVFHGVDSRITRLEYDIYGNIIRQEENLSSSGRINRSVTRKIYIDNPDDFAEIADFKPYADTGFIIPSLDKTRHSLPLGVMTTNYTPLSEDGGLLTGEGRATYSFNYFEYNALGQRKRSAAWDSSREEWLVNHAEYDNDGAATPVYGNIMRSTDAEGHITEYQYDGKGYPAARTTKNVVDADGTKTDITERFGYDPSSGWVMWQKNARGFVTEYRYDVLGRVTTIAAPEDGDDTSWIPAAANKDTPLRTGHPATTIAYGDAQGNLFAQETDPIGARTTYEFDDFGQMTRVKRFTQTGGTYTEYSEVRLTYNRWSEIASITDPNGNVTWFVYDAMGRQKKVILPDGTSGLADNPVQLSTFDYDTNLMTFTNELGKERREQYDMAGRVIESTMFDNGRGITGKVHYDGVGNAVASFGPRTGEQSISYYNSLGLVERQVFSEDSFLENGVVSNRSPEAAYSYDRTGKLAGSFVPDSEGRRGTVITRDALGREIKTEQVYSAAGSSAQEVLSTTLRFYDAAGNIIKEADANNAVLPVVERKYTTAVYSARNQVLSVTDREGNTTSYTYNIDGTSATMTGPRGNS